MMILGEVNQSTKDVMFSASSSSSSFFFFTDCLMLLAGWLCVGKSTERCLFISSSVADLGPGRCCSKLVYFSGRASNLWSFCFSLPDERKAPGKPHTSGYTRRKQKGYNMASGYIVLCFIYRSPRIPELWALMYTTADIMSLRK